MVCLIKLFMVYPCTILILIYINDLLFRFVQIDFISAFAFKYIFVSFQNSNTFFVRVKEHTLGLHSIAKLEINMLFYP